MSAKEREQALLNQSRISFRTGNASFTVYSNTLKTPIVGPVITLMKSAAVREAVPGQPVTFAVEAANKGNTAAEVVVYDDMPEGFSYVPNTVHREGAPLPGADPVAGIPLGLLEPGGKAAISFQLLPGEASGGNQPAEAVNVARAVYTFLTGDNRLITDQTESNSVRLQVRQLRAPKLVPTISVSKTRAAPGDILRYTVWLTNIGDWPADVYLQQGIPNGVLFVRNSIAVNGVLRSGDFPSAGIALGKLAPGEQLTVTYEVTVPGAQAVTPGQTIMNAPTIRYGYQTAQGEPVTQEQPVSPPVSTVLFFPIIRAIVRTHPAIVRPYSTVELTYRFTNDGNLPALLSLDRLLVRQLQLLPGTILLNGVPYPDPGPDGKLLLGLLSPGEGLELSLLAVVSPWVTSRVIRGAFEVEFTYEIDGSLYRSKVISNSYEILIEAEDEE